MARLLSSVSDERKRLLLGVGLALVTVFMTATIAAVGKHLSGMGVHVSTIVVAQYAISFLLTLPGLLRRGLGSLHTQRPAMHLLRGLGGVVCFYCYFIALSKISLLEATLLRNSAPLMVPLLIFLTLRERVPKRSLLPLVVGFAGVILVLRPGFSVLTIWHLVGLFAGIGLAVSMISPRLLASTEPGSRILFYYFAISLAVSIPFFLWQGGEVPPEAYGWLLYMGVVMYLCFVLYTWAYRLVSASALSPTSYFGVVFGGLLDWLVWHLVPDRLTVIGISLVILGGVLVVSGRDSAKT
ncbi:DMT family transporter [uncultured Spongiibacter sp.]|uniref:DMT family transporter n=1 Tax=uncultured Spongiibacter sp. TaxID=870896 RepID=UPI0025975785|nr:DMT family transporter [uncultured Spongiibacter sp.]